MLLLTSDTHFSDKPRDECRFGLFPWLAKQQEIHKPELTFVLGDLTESKDRHSAVLVNRIIDGLMLLKPPIYILRGNHDGLSVDSPFFEFLNNIEGIYFITKPTYINKYIYMVPHQPTQELFDAAIRKAKPNFGLLLHNTFEGAIAETGARLSGLRASLIEESKPRWCYSGDVHKPQQCGPVTYIGSPFHVRFGDNFNPRVLLVDVEGKETNLYFECPRKLVLNIRDAEEIETNKMLRPKDQVKVVLELTKEEVVEWAMYKESILNACHNHQLEVFGVELKVNPGVKRGVKSKGRSNEEYFREFCLTEKVPSQVKEVGNKLLGG